ncbi:hypothetical protein JS528_11085 [Bifidobacterium sp. MA2]|uniref:TIGR02646 family protein n=1 Tax=Bifidobacterium santillanense TaxID=2809028 RepID=A0ABS5UTM9_9BIFI|nr:hypothetical protein [Bifidobacterium santillanense]MBT1173863.1 hypothetical protein [Bifidobacterium santillanense]
MLFVDKHASHAPEAFVRAVDEQRRTRSLQGMDAGTDPQTLWDRLDGAARQAVLDRLLREQGHLCVYCERPIGLPGGRLGAHVEHYVPRHPSRAEYPELEWKNDGPAPRSPQADAESVDYANLFAACTNETVNDATPLTCDKLRGSRRMSLDPRSRRSLRRLVYRTNGRVEAKDPDDAAVWNDIGRDDARPGLLNLNAAHLRNARRAALRQLMARLMASGDRRTIDRACEREIRDLLAEKDPREPFLEAKLYVLSKRPGIRGRFGDAYPA